MRAVIGLGNPGDKYKNTRHNVGFMVVDELAKRQKLRFRNGFQGEVAETVADGKKVLLLKPMTFMNLSGNSVREVKQFYKLDSEKELIVIYDDMDLPFGKIRLRTSGSSGGHNGVESIIRGLGSNKFLRVRLGIGKDGNAEDYVLSNFKKDEAAELKFVIAKAIEAVEALLVTDNVEKVMSLYNA